MREIEIEKIKTRPNDPYVIDIHHVRQLVTYWCDDFMDPLQVEPAHDNPWGFYIVKGHHRYHAAKLLGKTLLRCEVSERAPESAAPRAKRWRVWI